MSPPHLNRVSVVLKIYKKIYCVMYNEELWKECMDFHGHGCPGLAIGFRAALAGMKALGLGDGSRDVDEEIVCVSENDACGVDAIQWITGCTTGKGNLNIHLTGKQAWSFYDRKSGRRVRLVLKRADLKSMDRGRALEWVLNAPEDDLFLFKEALRPMPERARMFDNAICTECGETCREDLARLKNGKTYCLDCFDQYMREI